MVCATTLLKRFIEPLFVRQDSLVAGILYGLDLIFDLAVRFAAAGDESIAPNGETQ